MHRLSAQLPQDLFTKIHADKQEGKTKVNMIIELQRAETELKSAIARADQILLDPKMAKKRTKIREALQNEQSKLQQYVEALYALNIDDRIPYEKMHKKLQQKITKHQMQHDLAMNNSSQFKQYVVSKRQILFDEHIQPQWVSYLRVGLGMIGSFLLHLIIGSLYRWGMINPYITSFYKITSNPDLQTRKDAIGAPLAMFCIGLTIQFGSKAANKIGTSLTLLISVVGSSGFIFLSSKMQQFFLFVIFHNVAFSLCAGMLFAPAIKQLLKYVPQLKIYVNTVAFVGTGLGSVLFGLINTECMNPQNYYPQTTGYYSGDLQYIALRMPGCFQEMSYCMLGIGVLGIIMLLPVIIQNQRKKSDETEKGTMNADFQRACHTNQQALSSAIFWKIAVIIILSSTGNFYVFMNYKSLVSGTIHSEIFLDLVFLAGSFSNGAFRIVWGLSLQCIGFQSIFMVAVFINIIVFSLMPFSLANQDAYLILFTLNCIVLGGLMIMFANIGLLVFGIQIGEKIFSYFWMCFTIGNLLNYLIGNFLTPILGFGLHTFLLFIAMLLIAAVIVLITKFQGPWQNQMTLLTIQNPFDHQKSEKY